MEEKFLEYCKSKGYEAKIENVGDGYFKVKIKLDDDFLLCGRMDEESILCNHLYGLSIEPKSTKFTSTSYTLGLYGECAWEVYISLWNEIKNEVIENLKVIDTVESCITSLMVKKHNIQYKSLGQDKVNNILDA